MADKNNCCFTNGTPNISGVSGAAVNNGDRSTCINVEKIYDAARDKDCIEDVRVFLDPNGQAILDHASAVRTKCADVVWVNINVNDVAFNRGYYAVDLRFYFRVCFEATIPYSAPQEFCGIAVYDKQIVMFGSEGSVSIYTSDVCTCDPSNNPPVRSGSNLPKVVLEAATPICLAVKVCDKSCLCGLCCCSPDQVPENVCNSCGLNICEECGSKAIYVSLGLFSVIRMQRPVALTIDAGEFCIPDKTSSVLSETDPCAVFNSMAFPTCEFYPPSVGGAVSTGIAGGTDVCNPSDVLGETTANVAAKPCCPKRCG